MTDIVCRELFIKFMKDTQAYIDAAEALSAFSVPFPIDLENNVIPQSITWLDDLIAASDRLESSREKWLAAMQAYKDCVKSNRANH